MRFLYAKKWANMLLKKGTLHAKKAISQTWEKDTLKGFYIDYSSKIINKNMDEDGLPFNVTSDGKHVKMPISIIQYGLGACERWYLEQGEDYKDTIKRVAEYLCDSQNKDGSWDAFIALDINDKRSSMVQAEATAFLLRAGLILRKDKYNEVAKKAIELMIKSVKDGGTTIYEGENVLFCEFVGKPIVLNGWIYSLLGLYDYWIYSQREDIREIIKNSKNTLLQMLDKFDTGYWSLYNVDGDIASPFYHELHIKQLEVLYRLFDEILFKDKRDKWMKYQNNKIKKTKAICIKVIQKLRATSKIDMIE